MESAESIWLEGSDVRLELLPLGATLRRFEVRLADDSWRNIVLGARSREDYLGANLYLGMTVGRFANRIRGSRFCLDGVEHLLPANEGRNQLHGGVAGFHARTWRVTGRQPNWVEFSLVSPDSDQGYPGELQVVVRYELIAGGAQVSYRASTDEATVVNLTNHSYFNLKGEGHGDTDDHILTVHASAYTPTRTDLVPTGEIRDVRGSAADFRLGAQLGAARVRAEAQGITINGGFDHNFIVDGEGLREHCRLTAPDGLSLAIRSDQPAIQVYGGDHFDGTQVGTSGVAYRRRAGIALETQHYPDSPNQPGFPTTILRPGQEYTTTTQWLVRVI
ncbi:MAG: galactose mutarotase [Propionibacteriaceae bacterium]|nr:galactose mutarotase [Propionibacteriaceae bacterium]